MSPSSDPTTGLDSRTATAPVAGGEEVVEVPVELAADLHARPAGQVVRVAAGVGAAIEIRHGDKSAPGRSVLALMALGAVAGNTVVVRASGPCAGSAAAAVAAVLTTGE